jgi:hypothetical protein
MDGSLGGMNLAAALALGSVSLPVLPVRVTLNPETGMWTKRPYTSGWQTKATADTATIIRFWNAYPDALPGIALGLAGLIVLDADRHGGPDGVKAIHELISENGLAEGVIRVATPSMGEHYFFRNLENEPLGNAEGNLPSGINVRGRGGFIMAPGAIRADGLRWREVDERPSLAESYRSGTIPEISPWIVERLRPKRANPTSQAINPALARSRELHYAEQALSKIYREVASALPLSRNNELNKGAFLLGTMVGVGWISADRVRSILFQAAINSGLVRDDGDSAARNTIESGLRRGIERPRPPLQDRISGTFGTFGTASRETYQCDWGKPDLSYLASGRSTPPTFPIKILGPFWEAWCRKHAAARCVPVDYVAAGLLAAGSVLIGNARWAAASPEWREPPVLWLGVVGAPSAGKGPALDPTTSMLRVLEQEVIEATRQERLSHEETILRARAAKENWQHQVREALKNDKTPPPRPPDAIEPEPVPLPRIMVGDTTPEALVGLLKYLSKGLLLHRDELAGWLTSFGRYSSGGGEREFWIEAYGGRPFTIDRKNNPEPVIIRHLSVAVLGGIQPDKLRLVTGGLDDGLAARFLWAWPDPVTDFRLQREAIGNEDQLIALRSLQLLSLRRVNEGKLEPRYVPLSEEAAALFETYVAELKERDVSGFLAGTVGKAPGHVLRLALILEYLRWSQFPYREPEPESICQQALSGATHIVDGYFLPMAQRAFGEAAIPEDDRLAMELARWIAREKPQHFNGRKTRRKLLGSLREAKAMDRACEVLVEANWIRPVERAAQPGKGRPALNFDVNPALLTKLPVRTPSSHEDET